VAWDIKGKTVLLTGATSGIGLEASVALARQGARVVMVGRDPARTVAAVADVAARSGSKEVSYLLADFSSQAAIRALADAVRSRVDRLDVLVNNAGGVHKARRLTVDGLEATFAVNHLGYFLLTNLLLDLVLKSAPARVVTVASVGHRRGTGGSGRAERDQKGRRSAGESGAAGNVEWFRHDQSSVSDRGFAIARQGHANDHRDEKDPGGRQDDRAARRHRQIPAHGRVDANDAARRRKSDAPQDEAADRSIQVARCRRRDVGSSARRCCRCPSRARPSPRPRAARPRHPAGS